jgi:hypothetical protein
LAKVFRPPIWDMISPAVPPRFTIAFVMP